MLDNLIHGYFMLGHPERLDYDYEHIYALVAYRAAKASGKLTMAVRAENARAVSKEPMTTQVAPPGKSQVDGPNRNEERRAQEARECSRGMAKICSLDHAGEGARATNSVSGSANFFSGTMHFRNSSSHCGRINAS